MKRALKTSMETRFDYIHSIEENEHYIVSTFLDNKFKNNFYRNPDTLEVAKTIVINKLVQYLQEDLSQVILNLRNSVKSLQLCLHYERQALLEQYTSKTNPLCQLIINLAKWKN